MSDGTHSSAEQPTVRGLAAGQRHFARFVLVRPLGRGGMGIVWLARDESLGEDVALKFLPDLVRWDPAALAELKAETRRARQLAHPNIVRIHDLLEDPSGAAIAMEYIDGRTLTEERLARPLQVLDPAEIAGWIAQLGAALDYAHREARLVHRDLKPANLMLTRDGRIKVTDFGVARTLGETMLRVSQLATGGTLLYMSPQQALGEPPTPRDDIYALGATLYELLAGKPPFHTGNVAAQIERRRPDSIAERRRQCGISGAAPIPRDWEEMIAVCLAKQPENRPASAGEVAARLARSAHTASSPARVRRLPARNARLAVLGAILAVVGATAAWQWRPSRVDASHEAAQANVSKAAPAWPSDATRAFAAWNFDGDGRESSGRRWNFNAGQIVPTFDRLGRIDRAILLNGTSSLQCELPEMVGWRARAPFSVVLWVNSQSFAEGKSAARTLVALGNDTQEDLYWSLSVIPDGLRFMLGRRQIDEPDNFVGSTPLSTGRWSHVAVVSDGETVRLYVDGRVSVQGPIAHNPDARVTTPPILSVGVYHKFDLERFVGALDELRLWRRALSADEIARLASPEPPPRFELTNGVYAASDDLPAAVVREFGPAAALADWQEVKRWHADDVVAWADADAAAVAGGSSLLLQNNGQRHSKSTRHYIIDRFDGRKPDYYLAHDELGGMRLALGSWHGVRGRALARLPFVAPHRMKLSSGDAGDIAHQLPASSTARAPVAFALEWAQELKAGETRAVRAELTLRDGRQAIAVCAPAPSATFALALGTPERPEISRQMTGGYGLLRFGLVVRAGKVCFRAVNPIGGGVVFQEELAVDYPARDVARLTLRGVDSAELTVEE